MHFVRQITAGKLSWPKKISSHAKVFISMDTLFEVFSFLSKKQLSGSMELVCNRFHRVIERFFHDFPILPIPLLYNDELIVKRKYFKLGLFRRFEQKKLVLCVKFPSTNLQNQNVCSLSPRSFSRQFKKPPNCIRFERVNIRFSANWQKELLDHKCFVNLFSPLSSAFVGAVVSVVLQTVVIPTYQRVPKQMDQFVLQETTLFEFLGTNLLPVFKRCKKLKLESISYDPKELCKRRRPDGMFLFQENDSFVGKLLNALSTSNALKSASIASVAIKFNYQTMDISHPYGHSMDLSYDASVWGYEALCANRWMRKFVALIDSIVNWLHSSDGNNTENERQTETCGICDESDLKALENVERKLSLSDACLTDNDRGGNGRLIQCIVDRISEVFSKANSPAERRSFCLRIRFSNGSAIVPAYRFERSFELCNKATDEMLVLRTLTAQKNSKWLLRQTDYDDAPPQNPTKLEIKRMRKDAFLQQKENEPKKTQNFDNVFPKLAEILNTKCSSVDQRYLQKLMRDDEIICHLRKQLKCEDSIPEVADNLKRILEFIVEKAPFVLMDHEIMSDLFALISELNNLDVMKHANIQRDLLQTILHRLLHARAIFFATKGAYFAWFQKILHKRSNVLDEIKRFHRFYEGTDVVETAQRLLGKCD